MPPTPTNIPRALLEIASAFLKLGLISFGGPIAHLAYFRSEFVDKRRWLDDPAYADLVALCQFLPGPASSQVVFALGSLRAGPLGGLLASLCFTLPSASLMIAFAYGLASATNLQNAPWLHGLKIAAVAVVAQAVVSMAKSLCPDRTRLTLALLAAAALLLLPGSLTQLALIATGALLGYFLYRRQITPTTLAPIEKTPLRTHLAASASLLLFFLLLILLPALVSITHNQPLQLFDSFYRSGSLVFGGGHVVLPLLRAEVVPTHWLTDDQFLAGYGAAQAVPGPLFTFAAYLGAAIQPGPLTPSSHPWLNGLFCLLAIFLPAWLLIAGALPFWHRLRATPAAQSALRGTNATVVGILLAALYTPVITESIHTPTDLALALLAFLALHLYKTPTLLLVLLLPLICQFLLPLIS